MGTANAIHFVGAAWKISVKLASGTRARYPRAPKLRKTLVGPLKRRFDAIPF